MSDIDRFLARKTPTQSRARATVDAILEGAAQLFLELGYAKTTTNKVAVRAGVSIGTLYQYYGNKDSLLVALLARHVNETIQMASDRFDELRSASLRQAARSLVQLMIDVHLVDPELHQLFQTQLPSLRNAPQARAISNRARSMVRRFLEFYRDELRVTDLEMATFLILHTVEANTHAAVIENPEILASGRFADELVDLIMSYLERRD